MIEYSVTSQPNPQDQEEIKFYARSQMHEVLDLNDFADHIASHGTAYSRADIHAILIMCVDCMREQMLMGNKVVMGDMGGFWAGLKSKGTEKVDDFTQERIYDVHVNWAPGKRFKSLMKDAKFKRVASRKAQAAALRGEIAGEDVIEKI